MRAEFYKFRNRTLSIIDQGIPLDYIMVIPKYLRKDPKSDYESQRLENVAKNATFRIIKDILDKKTRPTIS